MKNFGFYLKYNQYYDIHLALNLNECSNQHSKLIISLYIDILLKCQFIHFINVKEKGRDSKVFFACRGDFLYTDC